MIKAIFLDMDGTLVDSELYYIEKTYNVLKKYNYKGSKKEIEKVIGFSEEETLNFLCGLLDDNECKEKLKVDRIKEFVDFPIEYNKLIFDGVVETIKYWKSKGLMLAICSSSSLDDIKDFMIQNNIENYIDFTISGRSLTKSKPSPEIYLKTLEHFNISINEAIIYEDSYSGIKAGNSANIFTVARKEHRFNLNQSEAKLLVEDIYEFRDYVDGLMVN